MSVYIVPILLLLVLIYSAFKKVDTYNCFCRGAKKSLDLVVNIFPFLIAIILMVELLKSCGAWDSISNFLAPVFNIFGVPKEVVGLVLLKPFTGSGSLAILNDVYLTYGADSYISRCASVIMASSETVFYVSAVYFSKTKVKRLLYALPVALFVSLVSSILACLFCKIL